MNLLLVAHKLSPFGASSLVCKFELEPLSLNFLDAEEALTCLRASLLEIRNIHGKYKPCKFCSAAILKLSKDIKLIERMLKESK